MKSMKCNEEWTAPETTEWNNILEYLGIDKEAEEINETDFVGKEFTTMVQAENFYSLYAKIMGFSIQQVTRAKECDKDRVPSSI
ncbi:hypothetical protein PanWU01x14_069960 [Parasponia andersonii]|uniref:Uncharacterized protein n=1 Tax=Parasponia andersonii TaxID=3476 RepID=A0A2P5DEU0_PARAD|nr:hypothetical protein PanWU01x14_069960 [Parasponia andersonii]